MAEKYTSTFKRLFSYVKPFKLVFSIAIIGMVGNAAIDALFISQIQTFIDEGITGKSSDVLAYAPLFVIIVFILRGLTNFMATYGLGWVGSNVVMSLRQELYEKIMNLPVSYHDQTSTGSLISKITYDTEQIENAASKALMVLVREGAYVIALLGIMFYHSWQLSIAIFVLVPIVAVVVSLVTKRFRVISKRIQQAMGNVTRQSEQMVSGHKVILAFGGQEKETEEFKNVNNNNRQQRMKMVATKSLSVSSIQIIASFALASVLYLAAQPDMLSSLSPGTFTVVITSMMTLLRPLKQLTNVNSEFQRGLTAAQSVFEILDLNAEPNNGTKVLEKVSGQITFNNVGFAYSGTDTNVIENLNLEIEAGSTVAFVGRSGSGKTTISNFIPRYYSPGAGVISLDGVDLEDLELNNLRSHIALMSQHVVLFNDTIANNIAYGLKEVSRAEIENAAKLAHVMEFASSKAEGLDFMIGENGSALSGGQRQRIAIARALLRNAPIFIMDEATSALDTESERAIQDALNTLMKDRTNIVIAHRLSTIENADKIVVMDQGRILEQGKHAELLAQNGAYAALYQLQFSEGSA
ncbi:lipid A export permease/ATP-binding protein MsbA [Psychrosphaera sp. B3R10]|uniref:lipid A export permease/ATP-binding protein MsbA n=1 Tax=unclassified Psychrosphaera TaxID=2641570 RepID=UPI001C09801D|nr:MULTISPECIES: lipid A export permease/ATP-binding protein MsbA [unclassified Psychrosphaera]MBU2881353.1 lipid A export permease/ATP-binding protein MsbA [Psychrosphaera sp. I2R16]MBU2988452.1 lipid A export permease/ATP-binding protein MsbA [Psychrosphaera sp. B3R10]MDO6720048.1 lipid A export permease/ATP-binding protein MsbA [Psychrosphaera sp. 1_MG-2023]